MTYFVKALLLSCFNIAPQYLRILEHFKSYSWIFVLCYCFTVLSSRYNIEFSRHSDTSSLKFILKLLMFDHSLRHFVLKFAELRDLQEPAGSSRTRTRNGRAEPDLSAAVWCEMIHGDWGRKKTLFPDREFGSDRGY